MPADAKLICAHCGDQCLDDQITHDNLLFCCNGCQMIYQILNENGMSDYYKFEANPGISQKNKSLQTFEFLDEQKVVERLVNFQDEKVSVVQFEIPQIHCSSCLWLLENLNMFNDGIIQVQVNFLKKLVFIRFSNKLVTLREVVELLQKIGYVPRLNYDRLQHNNYNSSIDKPLLYKIGIAGFCFANIMLLSFPEYLNVQDVKVQDYFRYINLVLAIPVLVFSSRDYLLSAWRGLRYNMPTIDVPIAIGIIALFGRSAYEILAHVGEGYLDSFTGFIFFLLVGKWFQTFTYRGLDFDRNYKSYFPIATNIKRDGALITTSIDNIEVDDVIVIKEGETVPVDGILEKGIGRLDYSFVTGESNLINVVEGDKIFAGAKHFGPAIELRTLNKLDHAYLMQLWNDDVFNTNKEEKTDEVIDTISRYFTYIILAIAIITLGFWIYKDASKAFVIFTSVLIVACPCALALTIPFCYGNMLRMLSESGLHIKNTQVLERIQKVNHIVFDKTGTITDSQGLNLTYHGQTLDDSQKLMIASLCHNSTHPLSLGIVRYLGFRDFLELKSFKEEIGKGIRGVVEGHELAVGSGKFVNQDNNTEKGVFIKMDSKVLGHFKIRHTLRDGVESAITKLKTNIRVSLLSGDNNEDAERMQNLLGKDSEITFDQTPKEKLLYIKQKQRDGDFVMMIGDGLNDAGALMQSDVGIVIADQSNHFSPACDGLLTSASFSKLHAYIRYIKSSRRLIYTAFVLAFLYNCIGLSFAVTGHLKPIIAAILMPLSSITIIIYGVASTYLLKRIILK